MKRVVAMLLMILILPIVNAQQTTQPAEDAGVTPDNFLWGLDKALDNLNLLLTFDKGEKAKKGIEIARERLLEVKEMINKNKLEAAEKGKEEHGKLLLKVKENVKALKKDNSTEQIKEELEIEKKLKEHENAIEKVNTELKVKIKIERTITEQEQALINSLLDSLKGQTGEVEIEIKNKKDKTKIKIKQETGKSGDDVEEEFKKEIGLSNFEKERAEKMRKKAENKWNDVIEKAEEFDIDVPDKTTFNELLAKGDEALAKGKHEKAKDIYEAAKDDAEELKKEIEKSGEADEKEEEPEIEVEIEAEVANVKMEIGDDEQEFTLETADKEAILSEIALRLGVAVEQIRDIVEFKAKEKSEDKKIKEKEQEAEEEAKEDDDGREKDDEKKDENKSGKSSESDSDDKEDIK